MASRAFSGFARTWTTRVASSSHRAPADNLFASLGTADVHRDLQRNIVSLRASRHLFDDLSESADEQALALEVEQALKPRHYRSPSPIIHRPFEEAEWSNAIGWPFRHQQASRYSDGSFGVWYGADSVETTVFETAYHWYHGFLLDAEGFSEQTVAIERKVYNVTCDALLLDLKPHLQSFPALLHGTDYAFTQQVGARLHREGHPGLVTQSVRYPKGSVYAILNGAVLSKPRVNCMLTYRLKGTQIVVERKPGRTWRRIDVVAEGFREGERG